MLRNGVKNSRFQCIILTISSALWYYKIYNKDSYTLLRYMKRGIKMKRKAVSIILALSMLLPTLNFAVSADEIKTEKNAKCGPRRGPHFLFAERLFRSMKSVCSKAVRGTHIGSPARIFSYCQTATAL